MTVDDTPPWALESCHACGRDALLDVHQVLRLKAQSRPLFALVWLCEECDDVLFTVGLYSDCTAARNAYWDELDRRASDHAAWLAHLQEDDHFTAEHRRCGTE